MSKLVKILFNYTESFIPPRCSKPRYLTKDDGEIIIEIPVLSEQEAPIALKSTGNNVISNARWSVAYHWWDGRLWEGA